MNGTRRWLLVLPVILGLALAALVPNGACAAEGTVTQVDVHGNGRVPSTTISLTQTNNGSPATVNYMYGQTVFGSGLMSFTGPPASITSILTITIQELVGMEAQTHTASISISVDVNSGAVTATGSDPDKKILGSSVTLTGDGSAATMSFSESFSGLQAAGDMSDRTVKACLNFSSGVQFCINVLAQDTTPQEPPVDQETFESGRNELTQSNYVNAFKMMTEQMTAVMLQQLPIIGVFMDAKHQLESQRLFATTAAIAHRDYHPSEQLCAFGTLARSTSVSKYKIEQNVSALNSVLQKRELLNGSTASSWGPFADTAARMAQFKSTYCDTNDNNKELGAICSSGSSTRKNKDIDFRRTLDGQLTLNVDFADGNAPTADEEDIIALAKNLFGNKTFTSISEAAIVPYGSFEELHDSRMLSGVRSVARHSFATLAGMRATGSGLSSTQLQKVMENLGVPAGDVAKLVGANPSYFAQMDIMTQKMFQDPSFMVNLYNTPTNVERMGVVLQGIKLMADRDKLDAALRREMLLSMMLEMKLRERQEKIANRSATAR